VKHLLPICLLLCACNNSERKGIDYYVEHERAFKTTDGLVQVDTIGYSFTGHSDSEAYEKAYWSFVKAQTMFLPEKDSPYAQYPVRFWVNKGGGGDTVTNPLTNNRMREIEDSIRAER
jgi:hypothetical protein